MAPIAQTASAVALTAIVGSIVSADTSSAWYRRLDKPPIQPPAAVFPIVWTALYTDIAVTCGQVLDRLETSDQDQASGFRAALAANLVLNAAWSWVFFKGHHLPAATAVAGALAVSGADLVRRAAPTGRARALALVPYAGWCTFATVLTAAIWRRNR